MKVRGKDVRSRLYEVKLLKQQTASDKINISMGEIKTECLREVVKEWFNQNQNKL